MLIFVGVDFGCSVVPKTISQISMYYATTRAENSGYANHRVTCLIVMGMKLDISVHYQMA
jgi:hypothetical protein